MAMGSTRMRLTRDDEWVPQARRTWYSGIYFRSCLESLWARFFDRHDIPWVYEPRRFYFESCSYLPDFWLPNLLAYVEVKPVAPTFREFFLGKLLAEWTGLVYFVVSRPG